MKDRFSAITNRIASSSLVSYVMSSRPVVLFLRFRSLIRSSLLAFSVLILVNCTCWAIGRFVIIWIGGYWDRLDDYYYLTAMSFGIAIVLIFLRYHLDNGALRRVLRNRNKKIEFEEMVAKANSLDFNVWIKKYGCLFLLPLAIISITGRVDLSVLFIFGYSMYLWNSVYIDYYARKAKIPLHLLPEPPKLYLKFYEKFYWRAVHIRRYGTRAATEETTMLVKKAAREVYAENMRSPRSIMLAVGSLVGTAIGTDIAYGNYTGQTPVLARAYSLSEHGWWSRDAKAQRHAFRLKEWGAEVDSLCREGSNQLDDDKVNSLYYAMRDERYGRSLKMEVIGLRRAELERREQRLIEREVELDERRNRLESLEFEKTKSTSEKFDGVLDKENSSIE